MAAKSRYSPEEELRMIQKQKEEVFAQRQKAKDLIEACDETEKKIVDRSLKYLFNELKKKGFDVTDPKDLRFVISSCVAAKERAASSAGTL